VAIVPRLGDDRRFHTLPYSRSRIVLLVGRDHRFAKRKAVKLEELEGERMVLREQGSATRRVLAEALNKSGVQVRHVLEMHTLSVTNVPMDLELEIATLAERREAPVIKAFFDVVAKMPAPESGPAVTY